MYIYEVSKRDLHWLRASECSFSICVSTRMWDQNHWRHLVDCFEAVQEQNSSHLSFCVSFGPFFSQSYLLSPVLARIQIFLITHNISLSFSWEHSPLWVCLFTGSPHQVREFCLLISTIHRLKCFHAALCHCVSFCSPITSKHVLSCVKMLCFEC